jgi:hypothetical protein
MDSPVLVRPAGNGPKGETGTTVRYQKTGGFLKPEGALIPPPKDAVQHRMGVEVHSSLSVQSVLYAKNDCPAAAFGPQSSRLTFSNCSVFLPFRILSFFYSTASFSASVSFIISLYFLMISTMI